MGLSRFGLVLDQRPFIADIVAVGYIDLYVAFQEVNMWAIHFKECYLGLPPDKEVGIWLADKHSKQVASCFVASEGLQIEIYAALKLGDTIQPKVQDKSLAESAHLRLVCMFF